MPRERDASAMIKAQTTLRKRKAQKEMRAPEMKPQWQCLVSGKCPGIRRELPSIANRLC